jgi:hypothetical protein
VLCVCVLLLAAEARLKIDGVVVKYTSLPTGSDLGAPYNIGEKHALRPSDEFLAVERDLIRHDSWCMQQQQTLGGQPASGKPMCSTTQQSSHQCSAAYCMPQFRAGIIMNTTAGLFLSLCLSWLRV